MPIRYRLSVACFVAIFIPFLLLAGCSDIGDAPKTGSQSPGTEVTGTRTEADGTDGVSSQGGSSAPATQSAPVLEQTDEARCSMTGGSRLLKWGDMVVYTSDDGIYIADLEKAELRLLSDARANKVYYDGEWLYYSPMFESGIYRVNLSGKVERIHEAASLQLWITEDLIYFTKQNGTDQINQTPQGDLCVMDKDGGNERTLIKGVKNYFVLSGDKIYYTDWNSRAMYGAELDGSDRELMVEGRVYITMAGENHIYYVDYSDSEAHCQIDLTTKEKRILGYFGADLHFNGKYYVMTRIKDSNGNLAVTWTILRIDPETGEADVWDETPEGLDFLLYEYDGWGYYGGFDSGVFRVRVGEESTESLTGPYEFVFFLDGYGYCPLGPTDGSSVFGRLEVIELWSGKRTMLTLEG